MAENEKLNNVAVDNDVGTMEDVDAIMKKYDRESNTSVRAVRSSSVWSSFSCLFTTPSRRALRRSTTCLGTISSWRQSARSASSSTP